MKLSACCWIEQMESPRTFTISRIRNGDDGFETEIKRLSKLSPLQYARERVAIADRFGVGVAVLDKLVNAERRKDDNGKQGRAISFPERDAWPDLVDGAVLFGEIADAIRRHVVVSDH